MAEQPTTPRNSKKFAAPNTTQNAAPGGGKGFSAPSERAPMTNGPRGSGAFSAPSERNPWQSEKGFSAPTQPNQLKYGRQPQDPWANRQQNEQREPLQFETQTVQEDLRYESPLQEEPYRPYAEQPYYENSGNDPQYGGYEPPKKKSNALIYVIIALAAALVLAAGAIIFITQKDKCASDSDGGETETASQAEQNSSTGPQDEQQDKQQSSYTEPQDEPQDEPQSGYTEQNNYAEPQDEPQSGNTEPQDEPQSGYTEQQTQEAFYPVKKNGKSVTSASELSLYDVVTFGNYPQTSLGVEKPIRWYVVRKEDNKVTLLSVYALDSRQFHNKNEQVTFLGSDIFKWLNEDFRNRAFSDEETAVMASPVSLMGKDDAMNLPLTYRKASSTEYAISQGADAKRCLWWVGDFSKTYEFVEYYGWWWYDTSLANCAYCVHDDGQIWEYQVNFSGKAVRPMVIVQF